MLSSKSTFSINIGQALPQLPPPFAENGKLSMANFERDQRKYSNFDAKKLLKLYKEDRPAYNRAIKRLEEAESRRVRKAAIGRRDASQKRKADAKKKAAAISKRNKNKKKKK